MTTQIPEIQDTLEILKSQISKQADVTVLEGETNQEIENIIQDLCDITSFARKLRHEGRICSFCGSKKVYAKGLCNNCYARYLRNGTAEYAYTLPKKPAVHWRRMLYINVFKGEKEPPVFYETAIDAAIRLLDERSRKIVLMIYKDGLTCRKIGTELQLTGSRIQQLHQAALRKLRYGERLRILLNGPEQVKEVNKNE